MTLATAPPPVPPTQPKNARQRTAGGQIRARLRSGSRSPPKRAHQQVSSGQICASFGWVGCAGRTSGRERRGDRGRRGGSGDGAAARSGRTRRHRDRTRRHTDARDRRRGVRVEPAGRPAGASQPCLPRPVAESAARPSARHPRGAPRRGCHRDAFRRRCSSRNGLRSRAGRRGPRHDRLPPHHLRVGVASGRARRTERDDPHRPRRHRPPHRTPHRPQPTRKMRTRRAPAVGSAHNSVASRP